ncbi:MAG: DUF4097 family beta strand repeat-containing protein [Reichenbachiella sp.]|uniref:DUF4097 family beta strand repeat-containing protein n=1 Tax=Reichenbachiella sp. TaxID=2184521 RepID=UPI003262DDE6
MNKTQFNFLLIFCVLLSAESFSQNRKYSFNEVYRVSDSPSLRINSGDGDVDVYPSEKNEIEVFYIVERNRELLKVSREDLEEDFTIEISSSNDFLEISVKQKYQYRLMDWRDRINISFEIYTPFKTSCNINCSDGDVRVKGLKANQKLRSSDGDIDASKITGRVDVRTSDGDIYLNRIVGDVEPITSDGDIKLRTIDGNVDGRTSDGDVDLLDIKGEVSLVTSDGDLNAENINGDTRLTTSDGDIRLSQSQGDMVLNTSDGSISFRDLSGSLKARTSDGQIKGNMLKLEADLELRTSDGSIAVTVPDSMGLDLLLRGETIRTELDNFSGTSRDHIVEGQVNGGGSLVSLHASGGSVSLLYE